MSRLGIWIANGLLFVLCCYLIARTGQEIAGLWLAEEPGAAAEARPGPAPPPRRTWDRRKVILERNLFNVSTIAPAQPEPEPDEDLEATKLPLKLLGTVAHSDPAQAWAAVEDLKQRQHLVVRVDDALAGSARVVRIERRRIVIDNQGKREELALEGEETAGATSNGRGASTVGAATRRPATRSRASAEELRERIQRLREAGQVHRRAARERAAESAGARTPANLFSQARLLPKYEGGQMIGVQVSAIREDSLFEKIGIQNGDTITELNGIQVTNPQESSSVLRELSEAKQYTVVVLGADGEERTLTYTAEE